VSDVIAPGSAALLSAREEIPGVRRAITALMWSTVVVNAFFIVGLIVAGSDNNPIVNVVLALACQWIPVTIFWLAASQTGSSRLPVVLAAAGVTFSAIGDTYYSFAMDADGYLPFPSLADPAYLLYYPLMVAALVALSRRRLQGMGGLILLETAVATVGASAVLAVVLGPVISDALAGETLFEALVALAYPLFDLILIAVIVGIASAPSVRIGRRWWALITGLGVFLAGDVSYAVLESQDAYIVGTLLDATWTVGLAFITWWVAGISRSDAEPATTPRRGLAVSIPAVAMLAGLAVLVIGTVTRQSVLAVVLAAVTVGLGALPLVFRHAMLGRMLAAQEEAVRRLTELDQAKTDILVTVNHEFRTPLTSINGHVELLLDGGAGELPPAATDMLRTIERNGARLQNLIDETFIAARETPDAHVRTPWDVADLVSRAAATVEPLARDRGITLVVDHDDAAAVVDADGAQLERALANLIDNAVKFSAPAGRVTVSIEASPAAGEVVIRIRDTGIGIPAPDLPQLFTRFFRASNVHQAAIPGIGLGLSIAQQIVHAHGGRITTDSAVGRGTTMTVRLPAASA
jgi:signal transduction histidine kinase